MAEPEERAGRPDWRLGAALCAASSGLGAALVLTVYAASGSALLTTLAILASGGGVAALQRWLSRRDLAPVQTILEGFERVAAGEPVAALDPKALGPWAPWAEVVSRLASEHEYLVTAVHRTLAGLQEIPNRVQESVLEIDSGRAATEEAVEETASLLANINTSIRSINSEVESLSRSSEEASSSILEMQNAIDEVARSAGSLHDSVDSSSTSIHEISASIRQVAESADAVQGMAEESAAAMTQMDRAIQQVGEHVREASGLTDQVSERAEAGTKVVAATIEGIEQIRSQSLDAKEVLERLAERIGEIGEIVDVIGSINDETNLLSLNAAIIAAQAGEQGKAFAVVANHVKTLAQRTAGSTKEIESLIRAVQDESANAVAAMAAGIRSVESGVDRSRRAGLELDAIRSQSREASARVAEIARAADEQARNSKHVAEAAQRTSSMVQQISGAMSEQSRAGDAMLQNAESALQLCRQVHRSTEEQRESSRFVTASINAISDMIRSIQRNTESHGVASEALADAVSRILDVARKSGERTPEVVRSLEELRATARHLTGAARQAGGDVP